MESSDPFTQEIGSDDPFAGSDFGDLAPGVEPHAPQDGASVESQEGVKPGAEVDPAEPEKRDAGALPDLPPERAEAEARAYRESHGEPEPDPTPSEASPSGEAATEPIIEQPVAPDPQGALEKAERALEPTAEPQADPTLPDGAAAPEAASAPDGDSGQESPASSGQESDDEVAPPPQERGRGKSARRRYLLFQVEGPGKLTQLEWYEDREGNLSKRGQDGARRQNVYLARGTEDALRFGYLVVGAPPAGAHLVAAAALHFQPKHVKPEPPQPSRMRLSIS